MAENLKIIPLGGLNEIGKNMTVYEYGGEIIVVDCGMAFPGDDMYGIDLVIPDVSYLTKHKNRIRGLFITHGHEDHIGAIPYVLKQVNMPIYCTRLTAGLIRLKLEEHGLLKSTKIVTVESGMTVKAGKFSVEFIHVNHSIADSVAFAIHTGLGTVVHTGDFKIDSTPIDGEVIEKNYDVGDNIDATTGSTSGVTYPAVIYDLSALTFDINIHELDINKIQVGQQVEITSDALDGQSFTGTVDKVNINGTTSNGVTTYPVTVRIDGSPQELKPGMNISARIIVEDAGQVLCIPVEAVSRGQNGVSLVKVAGPGALDEAGSLADPSKLEDREVTLGRNDESFIEVLSGLEEGETVFIQNAASANPWG